MLSSIDSRLHYRFDAFSTVHTKTFVSERIAHCDKVELYAHHATKTHAPVIFFGHRFYFDAFLTVISTVQSKMICMRFRFDPLSRAFSNRYVSDEKAQRISVDEA